MTKEEKEKIAKLRCIGKSYAEVGAELALSRDTVKSYCRRNGLTDSDIQKTTQGDFCKECLKPIEQLPKMKKKLFCCRECRETWWKKHPEQVQRKAVYEFTCAGCGRKFTAYGNSGRKYFTHECYIKARFGGEVCERKAISI